MKIQDTINIIFQNKDYIFDTISKYSIYIILLIITISFSIILHLTRDFTSENLQPKDRFNQKISRITTALCILALGLMVFSYFFQSNYELLIKAIGVVVFIGAMFLFLIFKLLGDCLVSIRVNRSY